jgi:broad specificity phosphatase PhoE
VFGGRIDMELSPRGQTQAGALADFLRHKPLDAAYASPMKRVQQTLVPFCSNGFPNPVIVPDFREVDFGDWTGHGWDAVHEKFGVSAYEWLKHLECGSLPNGECAATFRARIEPQLRDIVQRHAGQAVAIFCHGGVIRMMLAILLDLPLVRTNAFDVEYASVTEVVLLPHRTEIQLLNFTPWRDLVRHEPAVE